MSRWASGLTGRSHNPDNTNSGLLRVKLLAASRPGCAGLRLTPPYGGCLHPRVTASVLVTARAPTVGPIAFCLSISDLVTTCDGIVRVIEHAGSTCTINGRT